MGRKGKWFSSGKKAISPDSEEKKSKKAKKKWFGKEKSPVPDSPPPASEIGTVLHPLPPPQEVVELREIETEQTKHAYSAPEASDQVSEVVVAASQEVEEVAQPPVLSRFHGTSVEEVAAIRIQTAFRGYLARRALRALRGLVRLKSLVEGPPVKRQSASALKCMQALARVQSQIQSRRTRMLEENQALQRQLLQERAKELANLEMGDNWNDTLQSKEQIEASLLSKYEAAMRRERAMAYSFSHQQSWKKATRPSSQMFMDPNNPQWGWSWLERWSAAHSLSTEKGLNNDQSLTKNSNVSLAGGEITKAYVKHQLNSEVSSSPKAIKTNKPIRTSNPNSPRIAPPKVASSSTVARKLKQASPRLSVVNLDDDAKSTFSVQSESNRRHSVGGGSTVRDDESLASSVAVPSYMAPTRSAKARLRMQSPLGVENGMPEKESAGVAKKRLSFPASPARPRRHSGPPKVDVSSPIAAQN